MEHRCPVLGNLRAEDTLITDAWEIAKRHTSPICFGVFGSKPCCNASLETCM